MNISKLFAVAIVFFSVLTVGCSHSQIIPEREKTGLSYKSGATTHVDGSVTEFVQFDCTNTHTTDNTCTAAALSNSSRTESTRDHKSRPSGSAVAQDILKQFGGPQTSE